MGKVSSETLAADQVGSSDGGAGAGLDHETGREARAYLLASLGFFGVALLLGLIAAIQLAAPDFLGGIAFLSWGRLQPMAVDAFIYGWLTIGLIGGALFVLPRVAGVPLAGGSLARNSLGLLVAGYGLGVVAIGAGLSEGRRYLEMPLWADAISFLGLVGAAVVATRTVARGNKDDLTPSQWFIVSALWWIVALHVVGNIPGIAGINSEIQTAFYEAGLFGLWLASAALGLVYYLIPALTGRARSRPTRLSVIGFWSLAFVWAATSPRVMIYGAGPDWLETVGGIFSIGLLVPVAVIFTDFVTSMRGRWETVTERTSLRFALAGAVMFTIVALQNLVMSLRSSSAIVQFTEWVPAYEHLVLFGAVSFWLFAYVYHAGPRLFRGGVSEGLAATHYRLSLIGLALGLGAMWVSGLQMGFTWAAGPNSQEYVNAGPGFINTIAPLAAHFTLRAVGFGIYAIAQVAFIVNIASKRGEQPLPVAAVTEDAVDADLIADHPVTLRALRLGIIGLFTLAALMVWILPSLEGDHTEGTLLADEARLFPSGSAAAKGREIYLQEGCWYCHTQEVRQIVTDVGLGPVSQAGDYVHETPSLRGVERLGPDLMHAGSRESSNSVRLLIEHLEHPRSDRPWSIMPSYDHLSDADLQAVATYIASLE